MTTNEIKLNRVICGDSRTKLKEFPDNFFGATITDAPYELGFMSKKWDASGVAYDVELWKEVFRVMKYGAFLFCFGGTRTFHRVACAIEDAGFQIKDQMMWLYGEGFPKSTNISKAIDKEAGAKRETLETHRVQRNTQSWECNGGMLAKGEQNFDITAPTTHDAQRWNGMGTALKPSFEPIIMAMKPLEKGLTYAANAKKHNVAGLNIDAARIGTQTNFNRPATPKKGTFNCSFDSDYIGCETKGRWPSNVILSHSPDCKCVGTKQINGSVLNSKHKIKKPSMFNAANDSQKYHGYTDENGQETVDIYACVPNCPIRIMDLQSKKMGIHSAGYSTNGVHCGDKKSHGGKQGGVYGEYSAYPTPRFGDSGGASRFFYCAKAKRSEKECGLKDMLECTFCGKFDSETHIRNGQKESCLRNNHPTVKPLSVMEYLCKLIKMPVSENGDGRQTILDPFCGSGSTLVAAEKQNLNYIGIDADFDSVIIATARQAPYDEQQSPIENKNEPIDIDSIDDLQFAELQSDDFGDLI